MGCQESFLLKYIQFKVKPIMELHIDVVIVDMLNMGLNGVNEIKKHMFSFASKYACILWTHLP